MTIDSVPSGDQHEQLLDRVAQEAADSAGALPPALLRDYLGTLVSVAVTRRRLTAEELDACRELGARAALDGASVPGVVELYLAGAWRLWAHLPSLVPSRSLATGPAVLGVGDVMLRAASEAVGAVSDGYSVAKREMVRREESLRREFVDDLLGGRADLAALVERAERFGLALAAPHVVAVIAGARPFADVGTVTGHAEVALRRQFGDRDLLVATKDGMLVCVVPADDGLGTPRVGGSTVRTLVGTLARLGPALGHGQRWRAGVGRRHSGATGVLRSFEEAREALELAARLRLADRVVAADDLLVYRVLFRDQAAMADLVCAVVGPLVRARGGAEPLLETLAAYFDSGCVATAAAARLHLSVRAVTYRLERVRELTGYDVTDPAARFTLHAAVLGARLLDWPRQPVPAVP